MIVVSQSGETADTLASLRYAKARGQHVLAVVNVATSSMSREADVVVPTLAGPEIGVASTKAFTCQLAVLACLAIAAGRARGTIDAETEASWSPSLIAVPGRMAEARHANLRSNFWRASSPARDVLYIGRGSSIRWPSKARSSSRSSPTSTPKAMPQAN